MRTCATVICTAAAVVLLAPWRGDAQSAGAALDVNAILARPISPGTVALLAEHSTIPGVQTRLAEALKHSNPSVRGAAARVMFVVGLRDLVPAVTAALANEQNSHAAFEEARFLAFFAGPSQDSVIWDAAPRIGLGATAMMIASARGAAALAMWPRLTASKAGEGRRADFLRVATRGSGTALAALASKAARDRDVDLARATLQAAVDARVDVGDESVIAMLAIDGSDDLRRVALQHLVQTWNGQSPLPERLRSAVIPVVDAASPSADAETMLLIEVLRRGLGQAPRADAVWAAMLAAPPVTLLHTFQYQSVRAMLSGSELQTVSRVYYRNPDRISPIRPQTSEPSAAPVRPEDQSRLIRVATGYPPGLMSDAFVAAGCDLRRLRDEIAGGGVLTLRREGRAQAVSVTDVPVPAGCQAALRALLVTYTTDLDRLIEDGHRELVMVPFDDDFVSCYESSHVFDAVTEGGAVRLGGTIEPPKKTRDVRPVYPPSAQADRVQGTVIVESRIAATGCVMNAVVVRSVDPRLDWSATRAVLGWRFSPTLVNGLPVPIIMTVTVQFRLVNGQPVPIIMTVTVQFRLN